MSLATAVENKSMRFLAAEKDLKRTRKRGGFHVNSGYLTYKSVRAQTSSNANSMIKIADIYRIRHIKGDQVKP